MYLNLEIKFKIKLKMINNKIIESIIGSWRIEGLELDEEIIQQMRYLSGGKISLEEVLNNIKQKYLINSNP